MPAECLLQGPKFIQVSALPVSNGVFRVPKLTILARISSWHVIRTVLIFGYFFTGSPKQNTSLQKLSNGNYSYFHIMGALKRKRRAPTISVECKHLTMCLCALGFRCIHPEKFACLCSIKKYQHLRVALSTRIHWYLCFGHSYPLLVKAKLGKTGKGKQIGPCIGVGY